MRNLVSDYQPHQVNWDDLIAYHLTEARQMYDQMRSVPYTQWDSKCFDVMRSIRHRIYRHKRDQI